MRALTLLTLAGVCAGFGTPGLPLAPALASFSSAMPRLASAAPRRVALSARTLEGAARGSSTPEALFSSARPRLASAALRRVAFNARMGSVVQVDDAARRSEISSRMQVDDGNNLGDLAERFTDSDVDAPPTRPLHQHKLRAVLNSLLVGIERVLR